GVQITQARSGSNPKYLRKISLCHRVHISGFIPVKGRSIVGIAQQISPGLLFHPEYLLKHIMIHAGEKLYNCSKCGMNFTWKESLHKHMRTHTGEKPYSCSKCGMNFADPSNRLRHMMTIHTGEKLYNCSVCNKKFSRSCSMKLHRKIHDNDRRRFNCT
ncbi:hypothetical protein LOAG_15300, partial [Loa loa]